MPFGPGDIWTLVSWSASEEGSTYDRVRWQSRSDAKMQRMELDLCCSGLEGRPRGIPPSVMIKYRLPGMQ
jgi:hypothetical protein